MNEITSMDDGWHVPAALRRAWIDDAVADEHAWSLETHIMACASCRRDISQDVALDASAGPAAALVDNVRNRLAQNLPPQVALRAPRARRKAVALLGLHQVGGAWALALLALLVGAAVLDLLSVPDLGGHRQDGAVAWFAAGGTWIGAVAPMLPVLGVALAWGPGFDLAHQISSSTPMAGLPLVLWRTAGLLITAVPAAWAVELIVALTRPAGLGAVRLNAFIVPALVLTVVTLALGSIVGAGAAGAVVSAGWALGTFPALVSGMAPILLTDVPATAWAATGLAGFVVIVLRRDQLARLPDFLTVGAHS